MSEVVNVAKIRARVMWLAAQLRFYKGATTATFTADDVSRMTDIIPVNNEHDPYGGIQAVLEMLPADSAPSWDGERFMITDPNKRRASPTELMITEVLDYWRDATSRSIRTEYTSARSSIVRARLREGYTVAQLKKAVTAMMASSFHTEHGYTDTSHAFKTERLERWLSTPQDQNMAEVEKSIMDTMARRKR